MEGTFGVCVILVISPKRKKCTRSLQIAEACSLSCANYFQSVEIWSLDQ